MLKSSGTIDLTRFLSLVGAKISFNVRTTIDENGISELLAPSMYLDLKDKFNGHYTNMYDKHTEISISANGETLQECLDDLVDTINKGVDNGYSFGSSRRSSLALKLKVFNDVKFDEK